MRMYGITVKTAEGAMTKQWFPYEDHHAAISDWLSIPKGQLVEVWCEGKKIASFDEIPCSRAA